MAQMVNRLFRLRPGETRLVVVLAFMLFANSLALEISDVVAVSGFLSDVGVPQILLVYVVDMALIMLTAGLQSLVVDRFDRVDLLSWMSLGIAGVYIVLRLLFIAGVPEFANYAILFLLSDQQWIFFPLIFWVLASDAMDMAQGKRLFPLLSAGGFIGQIAGLGIAAAAPGLVKSLGVTTLELLLFNAGVYLLTAALVFFGLRNVKVRETQQRRETVRETLTEGWGFVREVPSFRLMMLSIGLLSLTIVILEFNFLVAADRTYTEPGSFQTFYSLFRMVTTIAAFVLQTFFTSRIIERLNIKNSFVVLPVVMLGCALLAAVSPLVGVAAVAFGVSRFTKQTVNETAQKSLLALVPEERRGRVSMFMDSYLFAFGVLIGSAVTWVIVMLAPAAIAPYLYLGLAIVSAVVALWATWRMRAVYDSSLFNWRLKRRQRGGAGVLSKLEF
jgi:ATP/ADP translocase